MLVERELSEENANPARRSSVPHAKVEDQVTTLHRQVMEAHQRVRAEQATVEALSSRAADLLHVLAMHLRVEDLALRKIKNASDFFRAVQAARVASTNRNRHDDLDSFFDQIETHGRYLAAQLDSTYSAFLANDAPRPERMLEADAILNGCALVGELLAKLSEMEGQDLHTSIAPTPITSETAHELSQPSYAMWAIQQLSVLTEIEPRLGAQLERQGKASRVSRLNPERHPLYRSLVENDDVLSPAPLAVFSLGPSEQCRDEFDLPALIRAAQERLGVANVLLTALENGAMDAIGRLPEGTRLFSAEHRAASLSRRERLQFVRDYLVSTHPRFIINCDCPILWDIYLDYGRPLSAISNLYALASRFELTERGTPTGFAANELLAALPQITAIYSNNRQFRSLLKAHFLLPESLLNKVQTLYQPVRLPVRSSAESLQLPVTDRSSRRPAILWAGPISRQALPWLLSTIARSRPGMAFEVYGRLDENVDCSELLLLPNVRHHSALSSVEELPYGECDAFLQTSPIAGLPRTLLAAGATGLPVVAADVGAVSELVSEDRGWLIRDRLNPAAYCEALDSVAFDYAEGARRSRAMTEYLARVHSPAAFSDRARDLSIFDAGQAHPADVLS